MNTIKQLEISRHAAGWILGACILIMWALGVVPDLPVPGSALGITLRLVLVPLIFSTIGTTFAAMIVLAFGGMSLRQFSGVAVDMAFLPVIVPFGMVTVALLCGAGSWWVCSFFFNQVHSLAIGAEVGILGVVLWFPFVPFLWPVLHRVSVGQSGDRMALRPIVVLAICLLMSLAVPLLNPTLTFAASFLGCWIAFCVLYQWMYPRFPRFQWPDLTRSLSRAREPKRASAN
jgi:hypothetical protein